jgi:PIN domain nuclease of toxin-antitoxin system
MNEVVFDASAMLALLHHERGEEKLTADILERSVASAVNLAEVHSKLVRNGGAPDVAWRDALSSVNSVEPYTSDHARLPSNSCTTGKQ